jgi:hypothetical protein
MAKKDKTVTDALQKGQQIEAVKKCIILQIYSNSSLVSTGNKKGKVIPGLTSKLEQDEIEARIFVFVFSCISIFN